MAFAAVNPISGNNATSQYNISDYFSSDILKLAGCSAISSSVLSKVFFQSSDWLQFLLLGGAGSLLASNLKEYIKNKMGVSDSWNIVGPSISALSGLTIAYLFSSSMGDMNQILFVGGALFLAQMLGEYIKKYLNL